MRRCFGRRKITRTNCIVQAHASMQISLAKIRRLFDSPRHLSLNNINTCYVSQAVSERNKHLRGGAIFHPRQNSRKAQSFARSYKLRYQEQRFTTRRPFIAVRKPEEDTCRYQTSWPISHERLFSPRNNTLTILTSSIHARTPIFLSRSFAFDMTSSRKTNRRETSR